jgi:hypothetical protein
LILRRATLSKGRHSTPYAKNDSRLGRLLRVCNPQRDERFGQSLQYTMRNEVRLRGSPDSTPTPSRLHSVDMQPYHAVRSDEHVTPCQYSLSGTSKHTRPMIIDSSELFVLPTAFYLLTFPSNHGQIRNLSHRPPPSSHSSYQSKPVIRFHSSLHAKVSILLPLSPHPSLSITFPACFPFLVDFIRPLFLLSRTQTPTVLN